MNITAKMMNDLDKIAPGVEALTVFYRSPSVTCSIGCCTQSLIGTALGMVATGIILVSISKKAAKEEIEESES